MAHPHCAGVRLHSGVITARKRPQINASRCRRALEARGRREVVALDATGVITSDNEYQPHTGLFLAFADAQLMALYQPYIVLRQPLYFIVTRR